MENQQLYTALQNAIYCAKTALECLTEARELIKNGPIKGPLKANEIPFTQKEKGNYEEIEINIEGVWFLCSYDVEFLFSKNATAEEINDTQYKVHIKTLLKCDENEQEYRPTDRVTYREFYLIDKQLREHFEKTHYADEFFKQLDEHYEA